MTTGIIAEFNPFHNGHKLLVDTARSFSDTVICVLSSNFVQRGDSAVFTKEMRTEIALKNGVDIVVELPTVWSMSTAQNFALGGVWQLYNMGCEKIIFGSECGDIEELKKAADILSSDGFFKAVADLLKSGQTFAVARQTVAESMGVKSQILNSANDNLGVEYILAAKKLRLNIDFMCIKRTGALHDGAPEKNIASASFIRNLLKENKLDEAKKYMPDFSFCADDISDIKFADRAILGILRQKSLADLKNLPDISEGIENKIFNAVKLAESFEDLCMRIKSKRYPLSRIRRLCLAAAIGETNEFFMCVPPYTRILGANKNGINALKNTVSINPVITKFGKAELPNSDCKKVFDLECKASDLYGLTFKKPLNCGKEYTMKFIKTEE